LGIAVAIWITTLNRDAILQVSSKLSTVKEGKKKADNTAFKNNQSFSLSSF